MYYYQVQQDKRCSNCKTLNQVTTITRGNDILLKCQYCNYESVVSSLTTTASDVNDSFLYIQPLIETF